MAIFFFFKISIRIFLELFFNLLIYSGLKFALIRKKTNRSFDEVELLSRSVNELMCNAIPLAVKMETGIGVGENWLEAH